MDLISILLVTVALIMGGLSVLVIGGEKKSSNKIFSLFILCCGLWSLGVLSFRLTDSTQIGLLSSDFNYFIASLITALFLHFALIFPSERKIHLRYLFLLYLPTIAIIIALFINPNLILAEVYKTSDGTKLAEINILNYSIYTLYLITLITIAYAKLFKSYLANSDIEIKSQIKFLTIGTLFPYLVATFFDLILAATNYRYVWVGPLMGFLVVYAILYAVYKHHLLNIKAITAEILTVCLWIFIVIRALLSTNSQEIMVNIGLLILAFVVGLFLIRSIRREVKSRKISKRLAVELEKTNVKLTSLNLHLAEKVAEQTEEVRAAYDLEKKARRDLEKLNETKDQFIMITQHHLRTPTTSIKWELEEMKKEPFGPLGPEYGEIIKRMSTATGRMMRIVDDFLSITALKVGTPILNFTRVSLLPIIKDVLDELNDDIARTHITITYPITPESWPTLNIDRDKIREVVLIILENAVRYNYDKGSITIKTTSDNSKFEFIVENTGIGISTEDHKRIWSGLFYRGDNARASHPTGMGVGLSVARAMVKAHGGTISIESEGKGTGAQVNVILPLLVHTHDLTK